MKLTDGERNILIAIAIAALGGILINVFFSYNKKIQVNDFASAPLIININTASAEELDKLPGVGKVTAGRIVDIRTKQGAFAAVEDLKKVKGITPKKFEKMRKYITTENSK